MNGIFYHYLIHDGVDIAEAGGNYAYNSASNGCILVLGKGGFSAFNNYLLKISGTGITDYNKGLMQISRAGIISVTVQAAAEPPLKEY